MVVISLEKRQKRERHATQGAQKNKRKITSTQKTKYVETILEVTPEIVSSRLFQRPTRTGGQKMGKFVLLANKGTTVSEFFQRRTQLKMVVMGAAIGITTTSTS